MNELTQELKLKFQNDNQEQLNDAFVDACWNNYMDVVKYLLTSPELKGHADIHANEDSGFRFACRNGYIDVIRYLLTSTELKEHADIHAKTDMGFQWACQNGYLNVARYLLTSPELTDHADIHADEDLGFRWACTYGHLDIVQYLLSFSDDMYIDFQKTKYNLDWSIENQYHDIVKAMIKSLYKNDRFNYLENISKIEKYCLEHGFNFDKWKKEIMKEDININSHTTELFV